MPPPGTLIPSTTPGAVRVRRADGAEFDLPAPTAVSLGWALEDVQQVQAPAPTPARPSSSAEPSLDDFVSGLAGARPATPAAPAAPPPAPRPTAPVSEAERAALAPFLTPAGQRALEPAQSHVTPAPNPMQQALADPRFAIEAPTRGPGLAGTPVGSPPTARPGEVPISAQPPSPAAPGAAPAPATPAPRPRARSAPEAPPAPPTEAELNQQTIDQLMGGPVAPQDSAPPSALDQQLGRIDEGARLAREAAAADAASAAERQDILEAAARQQVQLEREREAALNTATRSYQQAVEEARATTINPHRLLGSAGGMVGVAIATILGGLGSALTGGPNRALETVQRAIDRDIAAQEANAANVRANVGNARTFLDITRARFSDRAAAADAARALAWGQVAERATQQAAQLRDQAAALRAQELAAEATARSQAAQAAALRAQQDRELAIRRELLEQQKLAGEAALAERRGRGGGGGGARGTVPREVMGTAEDPLVVEAVRLGTPQAVAMDMAADARGGRSSGRSRLQQMVAREGVDRGRIDTGSQVPGWVQGEGAPILSPTERATIRSVSIADGEFRRAVARIERNLAELGLGERITGRLGLGSERYQETQHAIEVVRNQLRQISDMGQSLGAQRAIEHSVPDLNANTTADAILRNVRAAQRVKHDYVLSLMESYGYHPDAGGGHGHGGEEPEAAPLPAGVQAR